MKMKIHILVILSILLLTVVTSRRRVKRGSEEKKKPEEGKGGKPAEVKGDKPAEGKGDKPGEGGIEHEARIALEDIFSMLKDEGHDEKAAVQKVKSFLDTLNEGELHKIFQNAKQHGKPQGEHHEESNGNKPGDVQPKKDKNFSEPKGGATKPPTTKKVKRRHFRN